MQFDKNKSSFYFLTLDLEPIKKSLIGLDESQAVLPNIYYLLYMERIDSFYLKKQKEDLQKVKYTLSYYPANVAKDIHGSRFDDVDLLYYKADRSILLSIGKKKHKVFIKYISLIESFFEQFENQNFPREFFINIPN